jgi:hypothetical protein
MRKKLIGFGALLFIGLLVIKCDLPMIKPQIIGTYVNNQNYKKDFTLNTPSIIDTLILKADNTFKSKFYGVETYDINYKVFTTEIVLKYDYEEIGKASFSSYFTNKIYEPSKIILNRDLNHFYKKIKAQ